MATVYHTRLPRSPSSIIWYQPQGTIGSAAGKGIVSLEWQWQCVTDLSGLFTDGFKAWEGEQPTNTTHLIGYGTLYLNCMTTGS